MRFRSKILVKVFFCQRRSMAQVSIRFFVRFTSIKLLTWVSECEEYTIQLLAL